VGSSLVENATSVTHICLVFLDRYLRVSNVPHVASPPDVVKLFATFGTIEE
jgi:hypothetical protein